MANRDSNNRKFKVVYSSIRDVQKGRIINARKLHRVTTSDQQSKIIRGIGYIVDRNMNVLARLEPSR